MVYDCLRNQGIIQASAYVHYLPLPGTEMSKLCSYWRQFGHETDRYHDLYYKFQNLVDRGIISATEVSARKLLAHPQHESLVDIFHKLVKQSRIHQHPRGLGASPVGSNLNKYCQYHQLHGHGTNTANLNYRINQITNIALVYRKAT